VKRVADHLSPDRHP
jgi:hypothetical protein